MSAVITGHKDLLIFLNDCVEEAFSKQELFSLLFLHLRGIRRINTMLGYAVGEEAMHTAIERIRVLLPECDRVGQVSSDELVIVSPDCNSPSCAIKGSTTMIASLGEAILINGSECTVDPAVGIAIYPNDGESATLLLRHAALASERASELKEPHYAFFSAKLEVNALREFDLQQSIRKAISQRQFELHYQPKIDAITLQLHGCEALLRWRDQEGTLRMPGEFLAAAERGGLMLPIGYFVLQSVCAQIREWIDRGYVNVGISINISAAQFNSQHWVSTVVNTIKSAGIPPSSLTLEITEESAVSEIGDLIENMHKLRSHGVKVAIDDFGTGHSSLAYLSKLPVDEIKIDRFFVQTGFENRTNALICRNVIELAHGLGAKVTAEGLEEPEQVKWLRELGCDTLQGYLFSRPESTATFESWFNPEAPDRAAMAASTIPGA